MATASDIPWSSVIIPTYGQKGVGLSRTCIESLARTHAHVMPEIILVSDGDDDATLEALKAMAVEVQAQHSISEFKLLKIPRKGFAAACNAGIRAANGHLSVFLVNNDIEFELPTTLQVMNDSLWAMNAGIVGCRLLYPDRTIQHAGVVFVPNPSGSTPMGYFDHLLRGQNENHIDAVSLRHGPVTGALLGIRRDFIERSGYLDERFGFTAEDIDLSLRAIECGLPPVYNGYVYAIHHEGASRGRTLEEKLLLEPEVAEKEAKSLNFLFQKWAGFDFGKFMVPGA